MNEKGKKNDNMSEKGTKIVKIRPAENKDIPKILELLIQVCNVHAKGRPDIFIENKTKYSAQNLDEIFTNSETPVFVAEIEEICVGYVFCQIINQKSNVMHPMKTLYIDDLCVDENFRGNKIGTKLYEFVKIFAKKNGCHNITLNVWECNQTAFEFYKSLGMSIQRQYMEEIL